MTNNSWKPAKWSKALCVMILIISLLLTGCAGGQNQEPTQAPETTTAPEVPAETTPTLEAETEPEDTVQDDPSLVIFRQAMVETPQLFAAAFFGYIPQDAGSDPFAVMREAAPQLCEDLPFLTAIPGKNIIGTYGYLFCIVPADENATVAVNRRLWNEETGTYGEPEVLYRSECGNPILVMCPNDDFVPDTEVVITDAFGNVAVYYPHMDTDYRVAALTNDNGESLVFDFTSYDDLPNPGSSQTISCLDMAGTWERVWSEVEGDRTEAAPGSCTVLIETDGTGFFWISYNDRDFPETNFTDCELIIVPGELYPGCGNDQWIAEVHNPGDDSGSYALTLLPDGSLLMQFSWYMDGIPMVSYSGYQKAG